jgi:hypothetical protein
LGDIRVKPHQHVQMIIHYRKTADSHREDIRKLLEPVLEPLFAVFVSFPEQERLANAARHAVVPASRGSIHQLSASHCHRCLL